jgi:hypothetical protein
MSKHHLIPVFAFAVAAAGCGGGSSAAPDGAAGQSGAGGMPDSTGGGAGWDAAAAGAAGTDASLNPDIPPPGCTTDVWPPATFCMYYLAFCGTTTPGYTTMDECMATYAAVGAATPTKQMCESYHLCNACNDTGDDRTLHCGHAVGMGGICL